VPSMAGGTRVKIFSMLVPRCLLSGGLSLIQSLDIMIYHILDLVSNSFPIVVLRARNSFALTKYP
jgi:hypothetical protein